MTNRFIIPLLCAASVAFARGTTGHKETLASSTSAKPASELSSTFSVHANGKVEFKLDVRKLKALGLSEGGAGTIVDVVSCPGADTCNLAVTQSRGLASAIDEALEVARRVVAEPLACP